ncbi:MAG: tetratricopeptide repeat protein [Bacteroidota bacterium]
MSQRAVIFLTFSDDLHGKPLEALRPEQDELQSILIDYWKKGWGNFYTAATSEPRKLNRDLNKFKSSLSIFHFSGHNEGANLQFADSEGKLIPFHKSDLQAFLGTEPNLKLVFLNACATRGHVKALQAIGVRAIIATNLRVPDTIAREFSAVFYDSFVVGDSLKSAFLKAKAIIPGNKTQPHIYRDLFREETEGTVDDEAWGLFHLDEEILDWKLADGAPPKLDDFPTILNDLPGRVQNFVGREEELSELETLLQGEKPVLLLNGIGGMGKTTLATKYLYKHLGSFDHVAWVSVLSENQVEEKSFQTAEEAIGGDQTLFNNLKLPFDPEQAVSQRAQRVLGALGAMKGNNLLVLDNVGLSFKAIRASLKKLPHWQVLITSRKDLPGLAKKNLGELSPENAYELFTHYYLPKQGEEKDTETLLAQVGYHTLTIELFARCCAKSPATTPKKILALLEKKELSKLSYEVWTEHSDREVEVYGYLLAAFELAKDEWSEEEKQLAIELSVLPSEEMSWELLLELFGISDDEQASFEKALMGLVEKGWITRAVVGDTYRMHQLLQEVMRYQFPPDLHNTIRIIKGASRVLAVDQAKDNPVDKFPYVIYGEVILSHISGNSHPINVLRNHLSLRYKDLGRYTEAADLMELALASALSQVGEDHLTVAIRRSNLSGIYKSLGRYEAAAGLQELALASALSHYGEDHPSVAVSRSNLSGIYSDLGRYEEAASLLELAIGSDLSHYGEDHPNVAVGRSNLSLIYQTLGRFEEAAGLMEFALSSDLSHFGEDHPNVAIRRSNLSGIYQDLGRYEEAAGLLELALASDLSHFGEDHPSVAIRRSNLSLVYQDLGRYEAAADLLELALASDLSHFGEDHPSVAIRRSNLSGIYVDLGRYEEAAGLLELALASDLSHFEEDHPSVAIRRSNLSQVYRDLGRYAEAASLMELALSSGLSHFGEEHPTVAIRRSNLSGIYKDLGRRKEALALIHQAYDTFLNKLGPDHPHTHRAKERLEDLKASE